jgi:hypothetical protein
VSAPDLAAEAAQLRELVAGLTADVTVLADRFRKLANAATTVDLVVDVALAARDECYRDGRAEHDRYEAAARAQQGRAGLQVLPGGGAARKRTTARRGGAR